ncbi:MAG: hypothetical protein PHS99_04235 [Candidatus Marinimicrobia bacterium]|nr:hypothetical protein [Candidatus Neomarinimicrobiota bacterium]
MSAKDLKAWWESAFSVNNIDILVSGALTRGEHNKLINFLSDFHPTTNPIHPELTAPEILDTIQYLLVDNRSEVSAISIGWHIPFSRLNIEFYPLWVFSSHSGEHRTFYGHLMKELRIKRGFNYRDYVYAEHFVQNSYLVFPQPGYPRLYQYFSFWIRPLKNGNVPFALRVILHDIKIFQEEGLDSLTHEETKQFLKSYIKLYARNQADYLSFSQDYAYYVLQEFPVSASHILDSLDYSQARK